MAWASASGSCFGTTATSSPKISRSSTPPGLSVETTGVPQASASRATVGVASRTDDSTNRSAPPCSDRDLVVGDEAEEPHGVAEAELRGLGLERRLLLAGAGDEQGRVGPLARAPRAIARSSV